MKSVIAAFGIVAISLSVSGCSQKFVDEISTAPITHRGKQATISKRQVDFKYPEGGIEAAKPEERWEEWWVVYDGNSKQCESNSVDSCKKAMDELIAVETFNAAKRVKPPLPATTDDRNGGKDC
ncbi:hypothetical protein RNZ50_13680 [Paracoccaceae bacterium Fryx2]|nr:hypothetical protein [Paracoccaceae bacterium Fryx2]